MNNANRLRNDTPDYHYNIVKNYSPTLRTKQKTIHWEPRLQRVKVYLESIGHEFIKYEDLIYYFDGLSPMNTRQLRLYYDRLIYREKKDQILNWHP
jgi:hypothetical protein